jgi:hypothetical protein
MSRPTDLPGGGVAHGPSPVAEEAREVHRAAVESLTAQRFHGVPPLSLHFAPHKPHDASRASRWGCRNRS